MLVAIAIALHSINEFGHLVCPLDFLLKDHFLCSFSTFFVEEVEDIGFSTSAGGPLNSANSLRCTAK